MLGSTVWCWRPNVDDVPAFGRWLIRSASWGVLVTLDEAGLPFGYVASYSDGGTGTPYFYLSSFLDPAGMNAEQDPRSCFTVSEAELGAACSDSDPQSPKCAKITLSGNLEKLDQSSAEAEVAEAALFADHPQFAGFPKKNGTFAVYKLMVRGVFLVNKSAPPRNLTVGDYLAA
ncbi:hypothetical protein C2S51_009194 [Perilla frutescens var. frutescens]|nr:hypothetical protein C2S51_009194 [Perilla frutescens var. frutescens]